MNKFHHDQYIRIFVFIGVLFSLFSSSLGGLQQVGASPSIIKTNLQYQDAQAVTVSNGKFNDTDRAWSYVGKWEVVKSNNAFKGQIHESGTINDNATINIEGSAFTLMYTSGPARGTLDVFVDGNKIASIDQHSSNTVYKHNWKGPHLNLGTHLLKFVHATGNTTNIDMIAISGSPEEQKTPTSVSPTSDNSSPSPTTIPDSQTPGIETATSSSTPIPSPTLVDPTATSAPTPTATPTIINPTNTSAPTPTASPTLVNQTATSTPTPTASPILATSTATQSPTPTASPTLVRPTATQSPTSIASPTLATSTAAQSPTPTASPTLVNPTATQSPTSIASPTLATSTAAQSPTPTTSPTLVNPTATQSPTPTTSPTLVNPTATLSPTPTTSPTLVNPTATQSPTPTASPTLATSTATQSPTPTASPTLATSTATQSPSPTASPTPTITPTTTAPTPSNNNYYVDIQKGLDTNPGSQTQPWKTIQKAVNSVPSGSTINVLPGNYAECPSVQISISLIANSALVQCFRLTADNVTVQGFEITDTNPNTSAGGLGVYMTGAGNVIKNNYIHDMPWGGILAFANSAAPSLSSNYSILNNTITHVGQSGIEARGVNGLIQGNDVSNVVQDFPTISNPPSWVSAIGMVFFGSGHVFRGNYIHDMHYNAENPTAHLDCWLTFGDSSKVISHDVLFDSNVCWNNEFISGFAGKAWQIEGGAYNFTMKNNVIHGELIAVLDSSHDVTMTYNTFVGNPGSSGSWGVQVTNSPRTTIKNNIFAYQQNGNGSVFSDSASVASLAIGSNCVYRSGSNPTRPADPGDVWGLNPLFVNESTQDYHLKSGSPCIDKATNSGISSDIDGHTRPQGAGFDIGAYEFVP